MMHWSDEAIAENGIIGAESTGKLTVTGGVIRFVAGCLKRERERLARIIESTDDPKALAEAIRDDSEDPQVFKWAGP